jgi:lysophospholipid acyltransferase (LPLAT)-like uncharacterized protein
MDKGAMRPVQAVSRQRSGPVRALWRTVREPLVRSGGFKHGVAGLLAAFMRLVVRTNRFVPGSDRPSRIAQVEGPVILAFWHGQHLMCPALNPPGHRIVALFSRSADAELNALVGKKFGLEIVRGSGGRVRERAVDKGGARALLALKKALQDGITVAMIADIPHGTPREAGLGIVTLAQIAGRPILPVAYATSRRKIIEKSWDKTTVNLPFGRAALVMGEPIHVPIGLGEEELEDYRRRVTDALNDVTARAYNMVDAR